MSFDQVPLMIGGGEALHSADLMRVLIWSTFRGQEGFLQVNGGRVETLLTPGAGFRVLPSPFVVNSRAPGATMQAYMGRIIDDEVITTKLTNTLPGQPRSDMVALVIKDPYPTGGTLWPYPGAPGSNERKFGPYVSIEVIEGVPAGAYCLEDVRPTWTGLALARLDRPANTSIITNDMIKRLNIVCNPLAGIELPADVLAGITDAVSSSQAAVAGIASGRVPIPGRYTASVGCTPGSNNSLNYTQSAFKTFPNEAAFTDVLVPTWATAADIFCVISNPYQKATEANVDANVYGATRFQMQYSTTTVDSDNSGFDMDEINSTDNRPPPPGDTTKYDINNSNPALYRPGNRPHLITTERMTIPTALRGKKVTLRHQARMYPDRNTRGRFVADAGTSVYMDVVFREKP